MILCPYVLIIHNVFDFVEQVRLRKKTHLGRHGSLKNSLKEGITCVNPIILCKCENNSILVCKCENFFIISEVMLGESNTTN